MKRTAPVVAVLDDSEMRYSMLYQLCVGVTEGQHIWLVLLGLDWSSQCREKRLRRSGLESIPYQANCRHRKSQTLVKWSDWHRSNYAALHTDSVTDLVMCPHLGLLGLLTPSQHVFALLCLCLYARQG